MEQGLVIPDLKWGVYADMWLQSSRMAQERSVCKGREQSSLSTLCLQAEDYLNSGQMFSGNVF